MQWNRTSLQTEIQYYNLPFYYSNWEFWVGIIVGQAKTGNVSEPYIDVATPQLTNDILEYVDDDLLIEERINAKPLISYIAQVKIQSFRRGKPSRLFTESLDDDLLED
jgi:hypothetical protein